jgi:uncharacterized protein YdeI (YjbR/CyaY-like superfamily)
VLRWRPGHRHAYRAHLSDREHLDVGSRAELRAWLAANHQTSDGVWFVRWKKGTDRHVPYEDVAQEALCFGWIDGQARPLDEDSSLILLTPRRPTSGWSRVNKNRIELLEAAGLIEPAGHAAIEVARANGSWEALDQVEALVEPDDLTAALDAQPDARREWDAFPPSAKKLLLGWIYSAKRPETRANRVRQTVDEAAVGRRAR